MLKFCLLGILLCGLGGSLQATEPDRLALTCQPVEGASVLFEPGRVVLLGEVHVALLLSDPSRARQRGDEGERCDSP